MVDSIQFTQSLLKWFHIHGRDLPWRQSHDPYEIWISEIMLQQTQVPRVEKIFYPQFLEKFPTIQSLASASWEDVYPVWKGLGYYSRGKNMLRTAQIIVQEFKGEFPNNADILATLPGIGQYTAHAILGFAFDQKVPAIDTNIQKIISILWPKSNIEERAKELISYSNSGRDWNGAMMDLASALRAGEAIPGQLGEYFQKNVQQKFAPIRKKVVITEKRKWHIEVGIACIHRDGKYLIQTRPEGKSFVGSWEFPGGKRETGEDLRACVKREIQEELGIEISVRPHFYEEMCQFNRVNLKLRFHRCQIQKGEPSPLEGQKLMWVSPKEFDNIQFLETNARALEKLKEMKV
ncbi:NUDIX domain-containing protein [Candidatus Gracilibacteria bacterium]|nr:NUDIX domain-containing protein [Candidatus Gracilibacteria bacterium]